jgi:uncharacterized protein (TIGR02265 family)
MHERKVSGRFVERVFSKAKGSAVAGKLKAVGLDVEAVQREYPAEQLARWLQVYSAAQHPDVPPGEALRRTGLEVVQSFSREERSLSQVMSGLPMALERAGNFFDVSVQEHAPHRYVAHFDDVAFVPTFFLGVMEGVTSSSVSWSPSGLSGARYVVSSS